MFLTQGADSSNCVQVGRSAAQMLGKNGGLETLDLRNNRLGKQVCVLHQPLHVLQSSKAPRAHDVEMAWSQQSGFESETTKTSLQVNSDHHSASMQQSA